MCGIFGYIGKRKINLKKATDIIAHRGPDAEGFLQYIPAKNEINRSHIIEFEGLKVALGFRRLAIIDLEDRSNQPYSDSSGKYHITFNGEIYNYLEIRNILVRIGYQFRTDSDTEVLLKAYIEWGNDCFNRFNGMWALAIIDLPKRKVVCSRDRFGIKPFFYHQTKEGAILWASEIKQFFATGVEKVLNENVIKDFIDKNIIDFSDETFFSGINHIPAGHLMEVTLENKEPEIIIKRYWELVEKEEYLDISYSEAQERFKYLFLDSIKLRFRSDVPVGSCLSGGLDSSSIVSVAAHSLNIPIHTFTSKFDIKAFDESQYVHMLSEYYPNIHSKFCQLNEDLFLSEIDQVLFHQDEPFGSMSILAQWEVMKLAKHNDVKVLLDGQGGDELLAGYRKYYAFYLKEKLLKGQLGKFGSAFYNLIINREFQFFDFKQFKRYLEINPRLNYYSELGKRLKSRVNIGLGATNGTRDRSKLDVEKFSFPPLLRFEDRNSMAFSIETRVPFMDYRLVEFLYSIDSDHKIKDGYTKAIMRDALDGILPEMIQKRKSKLGFSTPQEIWMGGKLKPFFVDYFSHMKNPYFNIGEIVHAFSSYPGNNISSDFFFRIFCFCQFYKKHFD